MDAAELTELFEDHAAAVGPYLLGCELTVTTARGAVRVRLTEVEAYGDQGEDPGAHSYNGRTLRNASLFGPPGHAYIYRSYGIHFCLNLVCHAAGAGGSLLRAAEVVEGRDLALDRRGGRDTGLKLLSGPGRLGQGLGVALSMDGSRVEIADELPEMGTPSGSRVASPVRFVLTPPTTPPPAEQIAAGPRVGVSGIGGSWEYPWRFWLDGDRTVSAYRPGKKVPVMGESESRNGKG